MPPCRLLRCGMSLRLWLTAAFLIASSLWGAEQEQENELIPSSPFEIATLSSEDNFLVGGVVSPLSGQPCLRSVDLIAKGAQEIILSRIYLAPWMPPRFAKHENENTGALYYHLRNHYRGWVFLPHIYLDITKKKHNTYQLCLPDPSGIILHFQFSGSHDCNPTFTSEQTAMSNCLGDTPSGKYDLRNTTLFVREETNRVIVHAPDGTHRHYTNKHPINQSTLRYTLEKEILPNGKVLRYSYNRGDHPTLIQSLDPQERYIYASINIQGNPRENSFLLCSPTCTFTTSTGKTATYYYQKRAIDWFFKDSHGKAEYHYPSPPFLSGASTPFYRCESSSYCPHYLLEVYRGNPLMFNASYTPYSKENIPPHYRVNQLYLPVGPDGALHPLYSFHYDPPLAGQRPGRATAYKADNTRVDYLFHSNLLPAAIYSYDEQAICRKQKIIDWYGNQRLSCIQLKDGQGRLYSTKRYAYDNSGNPIEETLTGDLTGSGKQQSVTIRRKFSEEGRHLLLREEYEEGKVLLFNYLPNTNLVTAKYTQDHEQILLRELFEYDDSNNLICHIRDNGTSSSPQDLTGVTERHITRYHLRQEQPFLHMPEWIVENYLEQGEEKLLTKKHLLYDGWGNIVKEEIYDEMGRLAYTLEKEYNERGDLLSETNPLCQKALYHYDEKGRRILEINYGKTLRKEIQYNAQGQITKLQEISPTHTHTTTYRYNINGDLIQKTDTFDNSTHYLYDPITHQPLQIDTPPIASLEGQTPVTTTSTYDSFGNEITHTDPCGHTTHTRYNTYGSPIEILHPDGSRESFLYSKEGKLLQHIDTEGLTLHYSYDVMGRITTKSYHLEGEIAQETYSYNSFHLLKQTDIEGNPTTFTYDSAGREKRRECCGKITETRYDPLGRVATLCKNNTLLIHYTRDLLGQILEERQTDTSGTLLAKTSYTYDVDGNQNSILREVGGEQAQETFLYDSFQRLLEHKDPLATTTTTFYNENALNPLGQKVLQITTTDPRGTITQETQDPYHRLVKQEILSNHGKTISSLDKIYDPTGHLIEQQDHIYTDATYQKSLKTRYSYTPRGYIASLTRAFDTPDARTTHYSYTPSGRVATKTLQGGITLTYHYSPLGYLDHLNSSDRTIDHTFTYNRLGHLLQAKDNLHNLTVERQVDPHGNILSETLNTHTLCKTYDQFDRPLSIRLPDGSEIHYTYDPLFVRSVSRHSPSGDILYTHSYSSYDTSGHLLAESLIGNLGKITHTYDLKGRCSALSSPYFTQECSYDPCDNLIESIIDGSSTRYSYDDLSQLTAEGSTSYRYNSHYNRTQKDTVPLEHNSLDELTHFGSISCSYDLHGNQILKQTPQETWHYSFDPLNRLIGATNGTTKLQFIYDPLHRKIAKQTQKEVESYLYDGNIEIGALDEQGSLKQLKVLGRGAIPLAIELNGNPYGCLTDCQRNVQRLIDPVNGQCAQSYAFGAFGEEKKSQAPEPFNPWRYSAKRLDPHLRLIDFGRRFYDPELAIWLTTDPAGFVDSMNLYQYVLNNPLRYTDPDGQFVQFMVPLLVWGAELVLPTLTAWAVPMAYTVITGAVLYEGYKAIEALNDAAAYKAREERQAELQDLAEKGKRFEAEKKKKGSVDPTLPANPDDLLKRPGWKETTHPDAGKKGHRIFENEKTGEIIRHDQGKPGQTGHKAQDHYHHQVPNGKGGYNYVDGKGNPVPPGSNQAHLYPNTIK